MYQGKRCLLLSCRKELIREHKPLPLNTSNLALYVIASSSHQSIRDNTSFQRTFVEKKSDSILAGAFGLAFS